MDNFKIIDVPRAKMINDCKNAKVKLPKIGTAIGSTEDSD
jgi:hypothetical protein